jgi:hypothetical protein
MLTLLNAKVREFCNKLSAIKTPHPRLVVEEMAIAVIKNNDYIGDEAREKLADAVHDSSILPSTKLVLAWGVWNPSVGDFRTTDEEMEHVERWLHEAKKEQDLL